MTDLLNPSILGTIRSHARLEKRRLKGTQGLPRGGRGEGGAGKRKILDLNHLIGSE